MGLKEAFVKVLPDHMKPPIEAQSFEEFLGLLETRSATQVTATPGRKTLFITSGTRTAVPGTHYEYNITFNAKGSTGRKIVYYDPCQQKFVEQSDFINTHGGAIGARGLTDDLEERYMLTTFVTADTKLTELRERNPNCRTYIQDSNRTFTQQDYDELRTRAAQENIRPW